MTTSQSSHNISHDWPCVFRRVVAGTRGSHTSAPAGCRPGLLPRAAWPAPAAASPVPRIPSRYSTRGCSPGSRGGGFGVGRFGAMTGWIFEESLDVGVESFDGVDFGTQSEMIMIYWRGNEVKKVLWRLMIELQQWDDEKVNEFGKEMAKSYRFVE